LRDSENGRADSSDAQSSFFIESVKRDIHSEKYQRYGTSKAKKLRAFWEIESDQVVGKTLSEMLELWEYRNPSPTDEEKAKLKRCQRIVRRLLGETGSEAKSEVTEDQFLRYDFRDVSIKKVPIEATLIPILESRFKEAVATLKGDCSLSTIFMCGSILEGLLLGMALANPSKFNRAKSSPKDKTSKVKQFHEWTLAQLIDVSCELGLLKVDVKKFSHALRDFRNYIHPYQQMSSRFEPDQHTAEICMQVLRAAVASLSGSR